MFNNLIDAMKTYYSVHSRTKRKVQRIKRKIERCVRLMGDDWSESGIDSVVGRYEYRIKYALLPIVKFRDHIFSSPEYIDIHCDNRYVAKALQDMVEKWESVGIKSFCRFRWRYKEKPHRSESEE